MRGNRANRRFRWYRSFVRWAAVIASVGGAYLVAATILRLPWYEDVMPTDQMLGLRRIPAMRPVGSDLFTPHGTGEVDHEISLLTAADGAVLVGERLILYTQASEANHAVEL